MFMASLVTRFVKSVTPKPVVPSFEILSHLTTIENLMRSYEAAGKDNFGKRFLFIGSRDDKAFPSGGCTLYQVTDKDYKFYKDPANSHRQDRKDAFMEATQPYVRVNIQQTPHNLKYDILFRVDSKKEPVYNTTKLEDVEDAVLAFVALKSTLTADIVRRKNAERDDDMGPKTPRL